MNDFCTVSVERLDCVGVERELTGIPVNREVSKAMGLDDRLGPGGEAG